MTKPKPITKEQVMDAARRIVEDAVEFWGLRDDVLTLDLVIKRGLDPTEFESPVPFKAAIEQLAMGLARVQADLDTPEEGDPVAEPTEEEDEEAAMGEYERRIAETTDPDELAKIVAEDEALLTSEVDAERAETNRRAARAYELRQKARKSEPTISRGITEEDEAQVYGGDEFVPDKPSESSVIETDPDKLHDEWVRLGRPTPGPDGKVVRRDG